MSRIAFIGLGRMGRGMAGRLVAAGHDVVVHNRTRERAADLLAAGAQWAGSPAEAATDVEAVLVMVSDDVASRAVWLGADGVLAGRPGTRRARDRVLHPVPRLGPRAVRRWWPHDNLRYLDCPVTGLPEAAAAGQLTLLVGGEPADVEAAEPLLRPLSVDRVHFGPVGAGTAYKLVINLMGAVQIAAAAEGMAMAERAGLDLELVATTIAAGQAASPQVVRNTRRMVAGDHGTDVVFSGNLRRKDAAYGVRLAETLGVGAPFGRVALDGLDALVAAGLGDQNESSIIEVARRAE